MTNYSAKHWAIKAEKSARDAESYASGIDLSNYATKSDLQSVRSEFEEEDVSIKNEINTLEDLIESNTSEINQQIANKANKDLSDVSQAGKETVVGWGMPDFSSGVSKTNDIIYQAECDGWLCIYGSGTASASAFSLNFSYSSDMSNATEVAASWVHASGFTSSAFIPVAKGLFYRASNIYSGFRMTFFPCKGV